MSEPIRKGNVFESIPKELDEEKFESLIESEKIKIERIISKGHTSPRKGWYDQRKDEWVIVLQGSATIEFTAEKPINLKMGGYVNIPAGTKHRVSWTDPEIETVWLAVHY